MRTLALLLCLLTLSPALFAQQAPVAVETGITDLLLSGRPSVGYRIGAGPEVALGEGWSGYDMASGVYFVPEVGPDGVAQVFMHCPWAAGAGTAFADYHLRLPDALRVRLRFQMGLRPGATGSDGVTYRVAANGTEVFAEHCAARSFVAREADLSAYAGREVVLRLSVDPGPAGKTSDDWSLWRKVELLAGSDEELAEAQRRAEAEAGRRRAAMMARAAELAQMPLDGLTSHEGGSVRPSVAEPTRVAAKLEGDTCVFTCQGAGDPLSYRFETQKGLFAGLSVAANGRDLSPAPFTGGATLHVDNKDVSVLSGLVETKLLSARLEGTHLTCEYQYTSLESGATATLKAELWPEGKSLGLELRGEPDRFSGFGAYPSAAMPVSTPFLTGGQVAWRGEGVYVSTVVDMMASDASGIGGADHTAYYPDTRGVRRALHDRFYLTVSSRYEEALANVSHEASPFLDELAGRTVLDAWGGSFAENEQWLRDMSRYRLDGLLIIKHVWQRDGYDQTYPNTLPANAEMGGDAGLRSLSLTAQALGHRFNVHENYYDYYPNAESFREADRCLTPDGKPIQGWDNGRYRAVILKPSKLMDYVREFTPQIEERYACDSAYHDIMPTWHVDFEAGVPGCAMTRYTHEQTRALCDYDREIYGGPVVFEAADPMLAGVYDGGCNNGVDTYRIPTNVAAEVLKVHPRMSNHGFGYYERWLPWGYGPGWYDYVMTDRELDKYRAYQTAFGRTGFIGQQLMKNPHGVVREYYLTQAFGRAYTGKLVRRLRYEIDGQWVDAGTAARLGTLTRLHVEYEGGQQVYVNLALEPWEVAGQTLPGYGTLTRGPRSEAWTALREGQISDYARFGAVTYADARSDYWKVPEPPAPLKPVAKVTPLEGGAFEMTVDWSVGRRPERDCTSFWHFVGGGQIAFQADHSPSTPATRWAVGATVSDGPLRLAVPEDAAVTQYEVRVGLYDREGRLPLVNGADQMMVGRLLVLRDGARATAVTFEPAEELSNPGADPAAYREGSNLNGKVIDFGRVATNGAVVLRETVAGTELVPVPLGAVFDVGLAGDVTAVEAWDAAGRTLPAARLTRRDGKTWLTTAPEAVMYRLRR